MTIVVPAYDEEGGIEGVVERLLALDLGRETELLVVNDGSKDRTGPMLKELQAKYPRLTVIEHPMNRGYGAALKTGFRAAAYDIVIITDADGTYPEDRIVDLLGHVDAGADMAVGARTGDDVNIPWQRRPAKAALRHIASYLAGVKIPDLNSGLRAIRRDLVLRYESILPEGFSFTTTITLASLTNHHRVDYVSIDYAERSGSSKIRPIRDTLGFLALIIRTVVYFNPLKVFYPVAGLLFVLLVVALTYDMFFAKTYFPNGEVATVGGNLGDKSVLLFLALVQTLTLGLVADLIDKKARLGPPLDPPVRSSGRSTGGRASR
ncbi:glycosyltransferase family 2 protein [Saltatorellus ferox]|uniref:glycosyltransferase family 2 protein n=1 Tax=Saltatorellus ferox TaxID=2528018 RepID=UPI003AF3E273